MMANVSTIHVPSRGDAPAITDLLGQQVQVYFGTLGGSIEYIRCPGRAVLLLAEVC